MAKPKHIYLISAARKVWYWSPERRLAIKLASVGPDLVQCAHCKQLVPKAPQAPKTAPKRGKKPENRVIYAVDHIEPVVPTGRSFPQIPPTLDSLSWDDYIERLMFGALQVLCLPCHKRKTKRESDERKQKRP